MTHTASGQDDVDSNLESIVKMDNTTPTIRPRIRTQSERNAIREKRHLALMQRWLGFVEYSASRGSFYEQGFDMLLAGKHCRPCTNSKQLERISAALEHSHAIRIDIPTVQMKRDATYTKIRAMLDACRQPA